MRRRENKSNEEDAASDTHSQVDRLGQLRDRALTTIKLISAALDQLQEESPVKEEKDPRVSIPRGLGRRNISQTVLTRSHYTESDEATVIKMLLRTCKLYETFNDLSRLLQLVLKQEQMF